MKNRKKGSKVFVLVILLLAVSLGYALLSTTLKINGFSHITKGIWDIHWDNVANESGVTPTVAAYIKDNTKKQIVEYEVLLAKPGDYYEFTVDAVNEGTYDGIITKIESKVNGEALSTLPNYVKYSVVYANDGTEPALNDTLDVEERRTYKVRVEYDASVVTNELINEMESSETYIFTYEVTYSQKTRSVPDRSGGREPGETACVGESFASDSFTTIAYQGEKAAKQETVTNGYCGKYCLGETKPVNLDLDGNGTPETYHIRISNCSTPPECKQEGFSQSACGFVVEFVEVLGTHRMNPDGQRTVNGNVNKGGWEYSDMRAFLNSGVYDNRQDNFPEYINYKSTGLYSKLPSELRKAIVTTKVRSGWGQAFENSSTTVPDNNGELFTTYDKLYLPSTKENLGKGGDYTISDDATDPSTRQLDYYASTNTLPGNYQATVKRDINGNIQTYWMRSAVNNNIFDFHTGPEEGGNYGWNYSYSWDTLGYSPLFRLGGK